MRFGIYAETQCPPEKSHYDLTWEIVRQMIHADEALDLTQNPRHGKCLRPR